MSFRLEAGDGNARAGVLRTAHGDVPTPAFMPVATQGSVKALDPADVRGVGANIVLSNTYHLYLRPGIDLVEQFGGLHRFMGWDGPILTDSGGFQGFSLELLRTMSEDGITFKSHIDGSPHTFTPESVVSHQQRLGSDIMMPLDVCVALPAEWKPVEEAVERTNRWAERSRKAHVGGRQLLFGIVQGGLYPDLRQRSAEFLTGLGFPGYSIGGLSVGESKDDMYRLTETTTAMLPQEAPRYLMGVGSPEDLVECVARGIDMFDCVLPTRTARNGALYVPEGRLNIDSAPFRDVDRPVQEGCDCYTCARFPAAYLHHLFRAKELLAYRLATLHNLRFVLRLMEQMRQAVIENRFDAFREGFMRRFVPPNEEARHEQRGRWLAARARREEGE
ncbi:MAG: tRNA guanosine(34) transglycosylase Tgt [SAR202 cluster bacterium]|nr:tRNA guanosine(34) transglycosylase Tgt [SAR202 cluster bacterium]